MNVKILSCWFETSYGAYTAGLRSGLEHRLGHEVGVIASNCGCGDPVEVGRRFMDSRCQFVEFPNLRHETMSNKGKQVLLDGARRVLYRERARRYLKQAGDADVLHFQQILNAFGSLAVMHWLAMPSRAARLVTVHELDPYQQQHPELNAGYARADGLIVHTEEMRDRLLSFGLHRDRIDLVQHGVEIPAASDQPRSGIIFYGGHKLDTGKGLVTLFAALSLLKDKLGSDAPVLTVHGHYGTAMPELATRLARETGVAANVRWLNEISFEAAVQEYQRALLCVLPYTGGFAGYPATLAMANGVPVIGTRRAGLPEHLGDAGVWVDPDDPSGLAVVIARLLHDDGERRRIAEAGRARAERDLSWDSIAEKTLLSYEKAVLFKQRSAAA